MQLRFLLLSAVAVLGSSPLAQSAALPFLSQDINALIKDALDGSKASCLEPDKAKRKIAQQSSHASASPSVSEILSEVTTEPLQLAGVVYPYSNYEKTLRQFAAEKEQINVVIPKQMAEIDRKIQEIESNLQMPPSTKDEELKKLNASKLNQSINLEQKKKGLTPQQRAALDQPFTDQEETTLNHLDNDPYLSLRGEEMPTCIFKNSKTVVVYNYCTPKAQSNLMIAIYSKTLGALTVYIESDTVAELMSRNEGQFLDVSQYLPANRIETIAQGQGAEQIASRSSSFAATNSPEDNYCSGSARDSGLQPKCYGSNISSEQSAGISKDLEIFANKNKEKTGASDPWFKTLQALNAARISANNKMPPKVAAPAFPHLWEPKGIPGKKSP